jgi:hypothetical protein
MIPLSDAPPELHPPNVEDDWPVWRVVEAGFGTLTEIEQHWWVEDVLDACEVIDVQLFKQGGRRSHG